MAYYEGEADFLPPERQDEASREHLTDVYAEMLGAIGLTGREVARLSGTRPQYISDIKRRQRPLSRDMFLRTLQGLYGDFRWLISGDLAVDTRRIIAMFPYIAKPEGPLYPLPVLQRPFLGPKMLSEDWDGTFACVPSPVKERAKGMRNPYILHLPFNARSGRFRKGDYLLVDQKETLDATYLLIKSGWGVKLVERCGDSYADVENGDFRFEQAESSVIGHVALLLMGKL